MTQTPLQILRQHPFATEFRPEHLERLAAIAKAVHFDAGQVIFHEGEAFSVFYLLNDGMVALELEMPEHVMRVQTLFPGDEFNWSAFIPHAGKHFQARAEQSVQGAFQFAKREEIGQHHRHPASAMML